MFASAKKEKLEHFQRGYPQLAAFLVFARDFTVVKRFDYLHMRNILELQDELAELEEELQAADDAEPTALHLSSRRRDSNTKRRDILKQIGSKLASYDEAVRRFHEMRCLPAAQDYNLESVENWFIGNKPLARSESGCYMNISRSSDHLVIGPKECDRAAPERLVDFGLRKFPILGKIVGKYQGNTDDDNILLHQSSSIASIASGLVALVVPIWLTIHVALLIVLQDNSIRVIVYGIFVTTTSFVVMLTTNENKYNVLLALLTYAAVPTSLLLR
ncbi:hypothetical protein F4861DRAFT_231373 [Xylaria intraflava]|nr:hypothetical protein F4861DRAFT_231373 [Xylaria intraflava]